MRVLFGGWGFSPWRGGGLTTIAEETMEAFAGRGHDVAFFFAGRHYPLLRRARVHRWSRRGVKMVELLNSPLPVGLDEGTRFPQLDLHEPVTERFLRDELDSFRPDLLCLHELMGLPSAAIDIAHELGVPVALIAHDYFPLCPTVKLYDVDGNVCLRTDPAPVCVRCCRDAPPDTSNVQRMTIAYELRRAGRAAPWLRDAARTALGRVARLPTGLPNDHPGYELTESPAPVEGYRRRREKNVARLGRLDMLVAVSRRLGEIYVSLGVPEQRVRTFRLYPSHIEGFTPRAMATPPRPVRFATLAGAASEQKGSRLVLGAARLLASSPAPAGFTLDVHGHVDPAVRPELERIEGVRLRGPYDRDQLGALLREADVGILPSVWEETVAHTGLELVASGVPVIANAIGGFPEYVEEGVTGWLNHSRGPGELAATMQRLVEQPEEILAVHRRLLERRPALLRTPAEQSAELETLFAEASAGAPVG